MNRFIAEVEQINDNLCLDTYNTTKSRSSYLKWRICMDGSTKTNYEYSVFLQYFDRENSTLFA